MASLHLDKPRYLAGLQCPRRLWLSVHAPQEYEPATADAPPDAYAEIRLHARRLFPSGVPIVGGAWQHAQAVARTKALMNDMSVPAVFGAVFEHGGVRVRVDALERLDDQTWGLRKLTSSTGMKEHFADELALQAFVLKGAGVMLSSVEVLHVNKAYVRGAGEVCWPEFFGRLDAWDAVEGALVGLPARLQGMRTSLGVTSLPDAEPGKQCGTPHACEFLDRCTADKPADWINYLPRLNQKRAAELKVMGIEAISAIPADFPLSAKQAIIRDAVVSGVPYLAPDLGLLLQDFGPPACYLDFEAMMPPIPLYEGTRPYQTIPFQWSLHAIGRDGVLHHREFLAAGDQDPRLSFAETLIAILEAFEGPILVYSPYEQTRLKELASQFPTLREPIEAILGRLLDLLPIVRSAVYLPAFDFSFSIKAVAPALAPGFGYDDLEGIANGTAASEAFVQLASGAISDPGQINQVRAALLAYCQRDTLAMVEVHWALAASAVQG